MQEKKVYDYLYSHGVKPSVQRVAVMKYLLEHTNHPAVDEIYGELLQRIPTLSKTTVYNTLKLLVDQGAVRMLTIDGKNANYDGHLEPHAHFLCSKCGRIFDIPYPSDEDEMRHVPEGFTTEQVEHYFHGICADCNPKRDC